MVFPGTRSSRFLVVLLHLVGVSTNLRPKLPFLLPWNETATQAVHPSFIPLEVSDLFGQDLDESQPHWIQDVKDQKCLGPMGVWGDCGDTTLWRIIPKSRRHARRTQWIRWATEQEDEGHKFVKRPQAYAFQLVDDLGFKLTGNNNCSAESPSLIVNFTDKECLSRRRKDNKLVIVSCTQDRAWFWNVNENGIMYFDKTIRGFRIASDGTKQATKKRLLNKKTILECVSRNASEAILQPCDGRNPHNRDETRHPGLLLGDTVQIQFVRPSTDKCRYSHRPDIDSKIPEQFLSKTKKGRTSKSGEPHMLTDNSIGKARVPQTKFQTRECPGNLPSHVDLAHGHAAARTNHTELRSASRMTTILPHQSSAAVAKELPRFLGYSNPILIVYGPRMSGSSENDMNRYRTSPNNKDAHQSQKLFRDNSIPLEKPMIRKIPMNPYIAASMDERWTDPQTGLVYRTDLCQYLGHERKDVGRHTLTGVGQYTKTMLNIKVYGVGFYVSKRDILADPSLVRFASLSSEELRHSPEFYEILRKMKGSVTSSDLAGKFDRTLFLKTNMQLATETMRASLDSDWKMLTSEAKEILIGSSMKARPATEETLQIIESPDNPNRCSCAQIAPEEYNADPSCCARGTELVFTWRKDGSLEIRLNGNFMDSFSRPDIAEGIFFEYLRMDNPMSVDFLSNVVEGFPFLLAPLSQVKGVASPVVAQHTIQQHVQHSVNPLVRTFGGFGEVLSSQAAGFAEFVQVGALELSSNAMEKAKSVGSAARNLGEDLERKRKLIGKHVSAFSSRTLSSFYQSDEKKLAVAFDWISDTELSRISGQLFEQQRREKKEHRGFLFWFLSWALGIDVSSLSAVNVTQRIFFSFVHIYLLMLLIASFPAQWTTRIKLITIKRPSPLSSHAVSESDNSDSDDSASACVGSRKQHLSNYKNEVRDLHTFMDVDSSPFRPLTL